MKNSFFSLFTSESHRPQTEEELQSQTIMWLRFPLVLLVLLIHVNPQNREVFTPIQTIDICHLTVGNIYSILGRRVLLFTGRCTVLLLHIRLLLLL